MKKRMTSILGASLALALAASPICLAKETFGGTLAVDPAQYSETAIRSRLEADKPDQLVLAAGAGTDYRIVYPAQSAKLKSAAQTLADALTEMTGASFACIPDSEGEAAKEIVIGSTNRPSPEIDPALGTDAYRIVTQNGKLFIRGTSELSTAYGVYGFMEDDLGCVFINGSEAFVPHSATVKLAPLDRTETPAMQWRNVYAYETKQQDGWYEKLRLNGIEADPTDAEDCVNEYAGWGTWCHSYLSFVDPDEYFDEHPEYFAMKDGQRIKTDTTTGLETQLCLSNPEVLEIVKEKMAQRMAENPDQKYWDFSVMDNWNMAGCECEQCRALDEAAGSGMGSLLPFINELAKAFPDKIISTLAYFHTINPPTNGIKAEENVVIKLCSMPGDQGSSYLQGATDGAKQFQQLVQNWHSVCDKIIIWDYVVDFEHLLLPFPNFAVQQDNQKFYEENGVIGVFHQASREKGDEFAEMRAWVLSQLMWKGSKADVNSLLGKYIAAAYGDAAPEIAEYVNALAANFHEEQAPLGLYDNPQVHKNGYLSKKNIAAYQEIFARAEEKVATNPVVLARVRKAKMPVLYAKMTETSTDKSGKLAAAEEFYRLCEENGVTRIDETKTTLADFQAQFPAMIAQMNARLIGIPVGVTAGVLLVAAAVAMIVTLRKRARRLGDRLIDYDPQGDQ